MKEDLDYAVTRQGHPTAQQIVCFALVVVLLAVVVFVLVAVCYVLIVARVMVVGYQY
jgi:hypothetical protein